MTENNPPEGSIADYLNNASRAEAAGVPVDWKKVAIEIAQSALNYIQTLEARVPKDKPEQGQEE